VKANSILHFRTKGKGKVGYRLGLRYGRSLNAWVSSLTRLADVHFEHRWSYFSVLSDRGFPVNASTSRLCKGSISPLFPFKKNFCRPVEEVKTITPFSVLTSSLTHHGQIIVDRSGLLSFSPDISRVGSIEEQQKPFRKSIVRYT